MFLSAYVYPSVESFFELRVEALPILAKQQLQYSLLNSNKPVRRNYTAHPTESG
jgi:hypothetical protein